jgi:hypothetical protein
MPSAKTVGGVCAQARETGINEAAHKAATIKAIFMKPGPLCRHFTFGLFGTAETIRTRLPLFQRGRRLATRESPRTAARPTFA